jgi:hypothetical protein
MSCLEESGKCPRLNQCVICRAWKLEKDLSPVEVPDQAGWIEKKACSTCLGGILNAPGGVK